MTGHSGNFDERTTSMVLYMLYSLPAFVAALLAAVLCSISALQDTALQLSA